MTNNMSKKSMNFYISQKRVGKLHFIRCMHLMLIKIGKC